MLAFALPGQGDKKPYCGLVEGGMGGSFEVRIRGTQSMGGRRIECKKQDSQGGRSQEKLSNILELYRIFCNRSSTKR